MTAFSVRSARASDAEALTRIHLEGKAAIPLPPSPRPFSDDVAYHARLISDADVLVATDQVDNPVGYAARDGSVLWQFYITPSWHRRGIGTEMLRQTRARAGVPLTFWCFSHNARALAFYGAFGAFEIDREGPEANEEGMPAIRLQLPVLE